jgi:hypothetical protein
MKEFITSLHRVYDNDTIKEGDTPAQLTYYYTALYEAYFLSAKLCYQNVYDFYNPNTLQFPNISKYRREALHQLYARQASLRELTEDYILPSVRVFNTSLDTTSYTAFFNLFLPLKNANDVEEFKTDIAVFIANRVVHVRDIVLLHMGFIYEQTRHYNYALRQQDDTAAVQAFFTYDQCQFYASLSDSFIQLNLFLTQSRPDAMATNPHFDLQRAILQHYSLELPITHDALVRAWLKTYLNNIRHFTQPL